MKTLSKFNSVFASAIFTLSAVAMSAKADVLVIVLDISSSTPIVQPTFMRTAMPMLADDIAGLPIGSHIKVLTVGDDKADPFTIDMWTQRSADTRGDTAKALASKIPNAIAVYLNALRGDPSRMQNESSLSPAFLDASKYCTPSKPCKISFLTDGMEYQPNIIAWPNEYKKPLPPIPRLDLNGANVAMYGVGQGVSSPVRIEVEGHWEKWLKAHKAGSVKLFRI